VPEHSLDGWIAPQFAMMTPRRRRAYAEMKTRRGLAASWPAISLVDIGALDLTSGEPFGGSIDGAERGWPS